MKNEKKLRLIRNVYKYCEYLNNTKMTLIKPMKYHFSVKKEEKKKKRTISAS